MSKNVQKFVRKRKKVDNFIYARGKMVDNCLYAPFFGPNYVVSHFE